MTPKDQKSSGASAQVAPTEQAKPFHCNKCKTKGFKTFGAKQRHDREMHSPHKYQCQYCEVTFKRRYQLVQHVEGAHPERQVFIAPSNTEISSNQGSRASIDSYSSDEAAIGPVQHARNSQFQRALMAQQTLPVFTKSLNHSESYASPNAGYTVAPSYAANTSPAFYNGNRPIPFSGSINQTPSYSAQPSYSTTSPNVPYAQSNTVQWADPLGGSRPTASALSFGGSVTMNPPSQPPPGTSYTGEVGQPNDWSQQPSPKPQ